MNKRIQEKGSSHVIVISILVVALIGALGFIFWNSLNAKNNEKSNTENSNNSSGAAKSPEKAASTPKLKEQTFSVKGKTVSFKTPETWTVAEVAEGTPDDGARLVVKNEKGTEVATYGVEAQVGGGCEVMEKFQTLEAVPVSTLATATPTAFAITAVAGEGGYNVHYGLTDYYTSVEDKQGCPGTFYYLFQPAGTEYSGTNFSNAVIKTRHFDSLDAVKAFMKTDEYAQLKQMFMSLKIS